ncbi:MAG: Rid family hydrolase [Bacteroidales bacterium]
MNYNVFSFPGVTVNLSEYKPHNGAAEYHLILQISDIRLNYPDQLHAISSVFQQFVKEYLAECPIVFKRFFLSDAANQSELLYTRINEKSAVSVVEQRPLNGSKIALWAYLVSDMQVRSQPNGLIEASHSSYSHLWGTGAQIPASSSEYQTNQVLETYIRQLNQYHCSLADNCIRTWFFIQNVDVNYSGMVTERNKVFDEQGLTEDTHYIASTGIGGRTANPKVAVLMDSYAISGIKEKQINHLYALTHLNRTSEYGVRFERGTSIDYGDRRHVFISGTASIDRHGNVIYPGDIYRQTQRMWANVKALLAEADCSFNNICQMIVYLRDSSDFTIVKELFEKQFPVTPFIIVHAPVCRPEWLIEMECIALLPVKNKEYAIF